MKKELFESLIDEIGEDENFILILDNSRQANSRNYDKTELIIDKKRDVVYSFKRSNTQYGALEYETVCEIIPYEMIQYIQRTFDNKEHLSNYLNDIKKKVDNIPEESIDTILSISKNKNINKYI